MTKRGSDRALLHQSRRVLIVRVEPDVEADRVNAPARLGQRNHLRGLVRGDRERLFAHHVLAGRECGSHLVGVDVVGARDMYGVDGRICEQRVHTVVDAGKVGCGRLGPGPLGRRSDDANDVDAQASERLGMGQTHEAGTDYSYVDVSEHRLSPCAR